jgi:hypothetical protein
MDERIFQLPGAALWLRLACLIGRIMGVAVAEKSNGEIR